MIVVVESSDFGQINGARHSLDVAV
jgi:hypothetical protein